MPTLPSDYLNLIREFAPYFSNPVWQHAQVLLLGAMLAPGQRTVTAILRIVGLSAEQHFRTYHRVLNRAVWSSWVLSRVLLGLLVKTFAATGPILVGIDDTIERRRGAKMLAPIPWAQRALPFLTMLAPSERYYAGRKRAHKKLTDWARQMVLQLRRWLPERKLVVVADSGFAVLSLLWRMTQLARPVCMITRLRLDAALYKPAPPRRPHQKGRPRLKGARLPTLAQVAINPKTDWQRVTVSQWYGEGRRKLEIVSGTAVWRHSGQPVVPLRWVLIRDPKGKFKTQALLCTDLTIKPVQIIKWFVLRWQLETGQRPKPLRQKTWSKLGRGRRKIRLAVGMA